MIVTTTDGVEGRKVAQYLGIVTGEAVMGTNIFRDMFAGIRDIVGGRSGSYQKELRKAKDLAMEGLIEKAQELGADAIRSSGRSRRKTSANGTAVKLA